VVQVLRSFIEQQLAPESFAWLQEKVGALELPAGNALAVGFAAMPRKVGKAILQVPKPLADQLAVLRNGLVLHQWTIDRLCRVWLLLQLSPVNKEQYIRRIEALFPAAEMNELVALYSALPLLAYPEAWRGRCAEGIRSNIGPVLEAIICNNPYPSEQLPEGAWNQLVLKAFFTEKRIDQIIGLDERANEALANTLIDFSQERRAAGRPVPPLLWRCVAPFITNKNLGDVEAAFYSTVGAERDAAALALAQSNHPDAQQLLQKHSAALDEINAGKLSWNGLAARMAAE
jgi:hypothetical protein